jgi:putative phosphoribosyl transferase
MKGSTQEIVVEDGPDHVRGSWTRVSPARGVVVFAHGSGSSRTSTRNIRVATVLQRAGYSTLLLDLLTEDEAELDERTARLRFDVPLLSRRVVAAVDMLRRSSDTTGAPVALFGASTGAAAALVAAAARPIAVAAVIARGGRPDLAGPWLDEVRAPTLFIVGGNDPEVLTLNEGALARLPSSHKELAVVHGATHLFPEPGALDHVAALARGWLDRFLPWTDIDVVAEHP